MSLLVAAPRVLTGEGDLRPGWVDLDGDTVAAVGAGVPPRSPDLDLPDGILAPGLVDAQVNGAYGVDLAAADDDGWARVSTGLPATGVTSFVPTFVTAPVEDLAEALRRYAVRRPVLDALPGAARTLGVHLEGPFLSPAQAGAHDRRHLRDPDPDLVEALLEAGRDGALRYVTLAPERPGALAAVRRLTGAGVRVAVGHSDATHGVVVAAADAGATLVTHLYNAQRGLHHREPGVVGAALTDPRLTSGLIVDGAHVLPAAVGVALTAAPGRIMLVTDAVAAFGMAPGRYLLGGEEISLVEGRPPVRTDGTIAGAVGRLDEAVGRAAAAGADLRAAVEAATRVPAAAVGRPDLGRLAPGLPADLVWLAPQGSRPLRARATWVAGRLVHGADEFAVPGTSQGHDDHTHARDR